MSDTDDIFDGGDAPESEGTPKKKRGGGLRNLLPTILKFVAIGVGALIFIVTVSVITYNIMNRGGRSQTVIADPLSPYMGRRPVFSYYDGLGTMNVRTRDGYALTVQIIIGFDEGDQATSQELASRRFQLLDFLGRFFRGKTAAELSREREEALQIEIREMLNTRFLDNRGAREVLFVRFDLSDWM